MVLALALVVALGSGPAFATSPCATQSTEADSPLIRDCVTLLGLKSELDPGGVLNWDGSLALASWDGVASNATLGVTELRLDHKGLTGSIPAALAGLVSLQDLWLGDNELTGSIPSRLGSLSNLQDLRLMRNDLSGAIPAALGQLANLQRLWLSGNELTGSIPAELGNLSSLWDLSLGNNRLTGSIPKELGDLHNLRDFSAFNNQLSGSLPKEFGGLSRITGITLERNQLTGSIPPELANASRLTYIDLESNQLTGSIPTQLVGLTGLRTLALSSNKLTGNIPAELGSLTALRELWLGGNEFTGSIPSELGDLSSLTAVSLSRNQLTGSIPSELGNLENLRELWLYDNQLSGTIPTSLGNLTNLAYLHLHTNKLIGSIPTWLGDLTNLKYLALHTNELTGSIPAELGGLTSLLWLDLSTNELSGAIPSELGNLASLTKLHLDKNELTGSIPVALGNLSSLENLGLSCNDLSGSVPSELGGITTLKRVELQGNPMLDLDPANIPANLSDVRYLVLTGECRGGPRPTPEPIPDWSATLTVGSHEGYTGYSVFGLPILGALSSTEFRVGDSTHQIRYLLLLEGRLYFGLVPRTGTSFVLNVAGKEFAWANAEDGAPLGTSWFRWEDPGLTWSVGDEVSVSLFLGDEPPNSPATGVPVISGTAQAGETLTADVTGITDANGLSNVSYSYQWLASVGSWTFGGTDIDEATEATYEVSDADVGKTIKVRVTFSDDAENPETLISAATAVVVAAATSPLTGFTLLDASARPQTVLATLTDGIALTLDDPANGSFGIRVETESDAAIGSVRLQLSGALSVDQTEGIRPYSLYGDNGASDLHGRHLPVGSYTLTATAYSEGGLRGEELGTLTVSFTVAAANSSAMDTPTTSESAKVGETVTEAATVGKAPEADSPATPLTGSVENQPSTHDGQTPFTFEVRFSEHIVGLSYVTLRDHAFTVTGGQVAKARRMDRESETRNIRWEITVNPAGNADVTIVLPATTDCGAAGAICTEDGRKLSNRNELTVGGPG